jgi:putative transcription factor
MNNDAKTIVLINPKLTAKKLKEEGIKINIGVNNTNNNYTVSGKKITDDEEIPISDKVGKDLGMKIQQARLAKNIKQIDLAKQLNITPDIIRDYENGTAIKNGNLLNKMSKLLGVKLTGKN